MVKEIFLFSNVKSYGDKKLMTIFSPENSGRLAHNKANLHFCYSHCVFLFGKLEGKRSSSNFGFIIISLNVHSINSPKRTLGDILDSNSVVCDAQDDAHEFPPDLIREMFLSIYTTSPFALSFLQLCQQHSDNLNAASESGIEDSSSCLLTVSS